MNKYFCFNCDKPSDKEICPDCLMPAHKCSGEECINCGKFYEDCECSDFMDGE